MAKMKTEVPQYGTIMQKGIQYYRTRIMDADGKQVSLYAAMLRSSIISQRSCSV